MEAPSKLLDLDDNNMRILSLKGCCEAALWRRVPALQEHMNNMASLHTHAFDVVVTFCRSIRQNWLAKTKSRRLL